MVFTWTYWKTSTSFGRICLRQFLKPPRLAMALCRGHPWVIFNIKIWVLGLLTRKEVFGIQALPGHWSTDLGQPCRLTQLYPVLMRTERYPTAYGGTTISLVDPPVKIQSCGRQRILGFLSFGFGNNPTENIYHIEFLCLKIFLIWVFATLHLIAHSGNWSNLNPLLSNDMQPA